MANMFNEDGTYNKTEWKAGDKITAGKLNKIELSLEAINNNDIDRHIEADTRLDALEESIENSITKNDLKTLETLVKDNKDAVDLEFYNFEGRVDTVEKRVDTVEGRVDTVEKRVDTVEKRVDTVVDLSRLGCIPEEVRFDAISNKYSMTDYSDIFEYALTLRPSVIILPEGNILIDKTIIIYSPVMILGHNTNIFSSPSGKNKTLFGVQSSNVTLHGIGFYSENIYNVDLGEDDTTALSSNVTSISVYGDIDNVAIRNCSSHDISKFVAINASNSVTIENCKCTGGYITIYAGGDSHDIFINKCNITQPKDTDIYGHALYLGHTKNVYITDTTLIQTGDNTSNIIKVGSNNGTSKYSSKNIRVSNCVIDCMTDTSLFYIEDDSDLYILDSVITSASRSGYARFLQINNRSICKLKDCDITLDSYSEYTRLRSVNSSELLFDGCDIKITNINNEYSTLGFVSGTPWLSFRNCKLRYNVTRGINLMDAYMRNVELFNCFIESNMVLPIGVWNSDDLNYENTDGHVLKIFNTLITNTSGIRPSTPPFRIFKNSNQNAKCYLSNITLFNYATEAGVVFKDGCEVDYMKNNVVDITQYPINT